MLTRRQSSIMESRLKEEWPVSANGVRGAESACRGSGEAKVTKNGKASEARGLYWPFSASSLQHQAAIPQPTSVFLVGVASALSFR